MRSIDDIQAEIDSYTQVLAQLEAECNEAQRIYEEKGHALATTHRGKLSRLKKELDDAKQNAPVMPLGYPRVLITNQWAAKYYSVGGKKLSVGTRVLVASEGMETPLDVILKGETVNSSYGDMGQTYQTSYQRLYFEIDTDGFTSKVFLSRDIGVFMPVDEKKQGITLIRPDDDDGKSYIIAGRFRIDKNALSGAVSLWMRAGKPSLDELRQNKSLIASWHDDKSYISNDGFFIANNEYEYRRLNILVIMTDIFYLLHHHIEMLSNLGESEEVSIIEQVKKDQTSIARAMNIYDHKRMTDMPFQDADRMLSDALKQITPDPNCPVCKGRGTYIENPAPGASWTETCGCVTSQLD